MQARLFGIVPAIAGMMWLSLGCGGEEAPTPSGRSMTAVLEQKTDDAPAPTNATGTPEVGEIRFTPEAPRPGDPITASVEASTPDGRSLRLSYEWRVNGKKVERATRPRLETLELSKGDRVELRVVASDGRLESVPRTKTVRLANRPPALQGVFFATAKKVRAGEPIEASPVASDPDGDPMHFDYVWYVNDRKDPDQKEAKFDTSELKRGDRVRLEVVASDGSAQSEKVRSATVEIANSPPVIPAVPPVERVDGEFRYHFEASDADGDKKLRFSLLEGPTGMKIDPVSGLLVWKPTVGQAGSHPVEVAVHDETGDGNAIRFNVVVNVAGEAPPASK